jgi:fucose 4-O-acetylase-like acetyltransferase
LTPGSTKAYRLLSPIALSAQRDAAVDLIKGTACVLMVAAHVHFPQAPWLQTVTMAAVLFFASTGMNLAGMVERRPDQEIRLAANGLFLIFAGLADNYVQGTLGMCDVFQSAGMAMLAMLLLRRVFPRYWTWLFPVPFLMHLANQHFYWKVADGGVSSFFLTPGLFPLLPWLSFYLLGAHLKGAGRSAGWLIGTAALTILAVHGALAPWNFDKFWMSPEYFLIGVAAAAFAFAALRRWLTLGMAARLTELRGWGANSLVFYLVNAFVIRGLEMLMPHGVALFLLSLAITAVLLRPALGLQAWSSRQRPELVLAAGGALALTVIAANDLLWPQRFQLYTVASFGLSVAFIAGYAAWKTVSRAAARRWSLLTGESRGVPVQEPAMMMSAGND